MNASRTSIAVLGLIAFASPVGGSECPREIDLQGGVNHHVYALIEYNGQLVAGGDFTEAGGVAVNYIARWDGTNWISLGGPLNMVRAMAVYDGKLFATNGGNMLATWDGVAWQTHTLPALGSIDCFAVYEDEFIIGGQWFVNNDFVNVIRWNVSTGAWQAIGAPGTFGTYKVKALTVHDGKLVAGGDFFVLNGEPVAGLAWWDESTQLWQPFEPGLTAGGQVNALGVYHGDLIVAGAFIEVGAVASRGIARWNTITGWQSLAGGVSHHVNSIAEYNGDLIAGGYFTAAGKQPVNNIARWSDAVGDWQPVGDGVINCCGYGASVYAVGVADGKIFAGGWFGFGIESSQRIIGWEDCQPCAGDITGDFAVNVADLLMVINSWGPCPGACPPACTADADGDCTVGVSDLLSVVNAWGPC